MNFHHFRKASTEAAVLNPPPGVDRGSDVSGRSFRKLVLTAASWTMGGYIASQFVRIAGNLILTRLLAPEMFGIAAIATMVAMLMSLLSDIGLHQAVIQSPKGDQQDFLDTAWTIQIVRGLLIWAACVVAAIALSYGVGRGWVPAQSVYAAPELPLVLVASSFGSVIAGFQSTKLHSSYRNLGLKRITMMDLSSQIAAALIGILVAWLTGSVWACVVSNLSGTLITTVLSYTLIPGRSNRLRIDRESALDLLRFGRWIMFSSFFTIFAANGDRILLGNWATAHTFGLYSLAFGLIAMMDGVGSRLYSAVGTPALSKIARDNPERLRSVYFRLRAPFDVFFIGIAGLLYASSQLVVDVLYDDRYVAAGPMLQILSFALFMARFGIMTSVYLALGEPRLVGMINCVRAILLFTTVPLCYWLFGFQGALWGIALHSLPIVPIIFVCNARHRLNSFAFEIFVLLAWPVGYVLGRLVVQALGYLHGFSGAMP